MTSLNISRREFIKQSASSIALLTVCGVTTAQTTALRLEWQQFKQTSQFTSFYNAIRSMRANTNAASPNSWQYWINVHVNYCPHTAPYFLAWHRGYLYYFEQQLRKVSGDSTLMLPYWNYYSYAQIPSEFTDPTAGNPFYQQRTNTNVYNALDLSPFGPTVWNFQRGTSNAYEPMFENAPHNPVHNLIGGIMASMQSPQDPIFYLHHANVDRLWHAWALPDGKGMPPSSNSYWSGSFTYSPTLTLARSQTYYPGWLGYDYSNDNKPTSLPPQASKGRIILAQAQMGSPPGRPSFVTLPTTPGRRLSETQQSLGGVTDVALDERSISTRIPLSAATIQLLRDTATAAARTNTPRASGSYQSAKLVLSDVMLIGNGKDGGFFYNVYLNLPQGVGDAEMKRFFVGTVGPFEIAGVEHHGSATLELPATQALLNADVNNLSDMVVSLVRVNGDRSPRGPVISIKELRIDLSTEAPWDRNPPVRGPDDCYC
jgi:tyrosinase